MSSWHLNPLAFLARVAPAGFFTALVVVRCAAIGPAIREIADAPSLASAALGGLQIVNHVLAASFYVLVAVLFVRRHTTRTSSSGPLTMALAVAGTWGAVPLLFLEPTRGDVVVGLVGTVLMVVGIALSCASLAALGRSFGVRPGARELVTRGPYRHVRHPLYVSEAITQLGVLVGVLSPLGVAIFVVYLCLQARRAVLEERVLATAFLAYSTYTASTPAIVPRLTLGGRHVA